MAMNFIQDDFLLPNPLAQDLYATIADAPIIDFHCHLPPQDIAANRQFRNLFEIWLEGDHYKWRAMRANGVGEACCTGNASPEEKFKAFARTVPHTLRNPIYHWTHLELQRYFGITDILNEKSADRIWAQANEKLQQEELSVWGILKSFNVQVIGTTDDPVDSLECHQQIQKGDCPAKVVPTFRPDKGFQVTNIEAWNAWTDKLEQVSGVRCNDLDGFISALRQRHDFFASLGGRASDCGLEACPAAIANRQQAAATFKKARGRQAVQADEADAFAGFLLAEIAAMNHEKGWVMQLHLGALRNVNNAMLRRLGPDVGCDTIGDFSHARSLANLFGELSSRGTLPRTVLYNLNPADNYVFAAMCGNFFEEGVPGKMQYGSGWWFLDQLEGMRWQINALSNLGLLSHFIGMLTDSRSFMSFPRHEYFRRLLCNIIGSDVASGMLPDDRDTLVSLVKRIASDNAVAYFGFENSRAK